VLLLAALVLTACSETSEYIPATGIEVPAFRAVDTTMREVMRKLQIPGASITVAKDGRIVYSAASAGPTERLDSPCSRRRCSGLPA